MLVVLSSAIAASRGDFADAFTHGLLVATAFVVAALVIAVVDVVVDRRIHRRESTDDQPAEVTSGTS